MININGKEYKINTNICLGTEKLVSKIMRDKDNPKNLGYMEIILKDILEPTPTTQELDRFRRSDRERIFEAFGSIMEKTDKDFKKKRSLL